jgi:hypothetical protein
MKESKIRKIVREEIKRTFNEVGMQQRPVNQVNQLRRAVRGKKVTGVAGNPNIDGSYQHELHFSSGERLLIQDADKLLFNEKN